MRLGVKRMMMMCPVWRPDSASRLAPRGALAEVAVLAVNAGLGNTAGSPSASSRELKLLLH